MTYVGLFVISLVNCGLFFVASLFTVRGDGNDSQMELKWTIGFGWIAILLLTSIVLSRRGRGGTAILLSGLTLPIGSIVLLIGNSVFETYASLKPDSTEFKAQCESVGATYFRKPKSPVRSIAYDWALDTYPPQFSFFKIDGNRNISEQSGGLPAYHTQIEFIEARCCRNEGQPSNGIRPFVRHPRVGQYYGISELSADALVTFKRVARPGVPSELG